MIASSIRLCFALIRGHWDPFCVLHAVMHGTETLVYRNHSKEAAASTCLAIIFVLIASEIHWFVLLVKTVLWIEKFPTHV